MELHAANPVSIVTHRHHHPVVMGVNGQPRRDIAAHQRVIARHRQRVHQPGKHGLAVMLNAGGFPVQDLAGLADVTTVGLDNRLVAQTDTNDGQLTAHAG